MYLGSAVHGGGKLRCEITRKVGSATLQFNTFTMRFEAVLVAVCTQTPVFERSGQIIAPKESMLYLGSAIHGGGKFGCEISRKVGNASSEFSI